MKACTATDSDFNACIDANAICECLLEEGHTLTCLGDCANPVIASLGCPTSKAALERSKALSPEGEGEDTGAADEVCDAAHGTAKLKTCVADNAAVLECLREGAKTQCGCLTATPALRGCMGACWYTVNDALMCEASAAEVQVANPSDGNVDDSSSSLPLQPGADDGPWYDGPGSGYGQPPPECDGAKLQACMAKDPASMKCIGENEAGGSPCKCFMHSPAIKRCMAECWVHVAQVFDCPAETRPKAAQPAKKGTTTTSPKQVKRRGHASQQPLRGAVGSGELLAAKAEVSALVRENALLKSQLAAERELKKLRTENEHLKAKLTSGGTSGSTPAEPTTPSPPAPPTPPTVEPTPAQCSNGDASNQLKHCVSNSPEALECLDDGRTHCECLSSTSGLVECLGACMDPISRALDCQSPSSTGTESSTTGNGAAAPECDVQVVSKELQSCIAKDPATVKCLADGTDSCECVLASESARRCVGSCWEMITNVLGCVQQGDNSGAAAVADEEVQVYIASEGELAPACADSVQQLKGCVTVDGALTTCVASGKSRCACFAESSSMPACAGACWREIVEALGCKTTAVMPTHHPLYAGPSAAQGDQTTETSGGTEPPEAQCDSGNAGPLLKSCVAKDPGTVACLKGDDTQCQCLARSETISGCMGPCWTVVLSALKCGPDAAAPTAVAQPEPGSAPAPECNAQDSIRMLKECINADKETATCFNSGSGKCECIASSNTLQHCLGHCSDLIVETMGCTLPASPPEPAVGGGSGGGGSGGECSKEMQHTTLRECMASDASVLECLKGGGSPCDCLLSSPTASECLGACAPAVVATLQCATDAGEPPSDDASGTSTPADAGGGPEHSVVCDDLSAMQKMGECKDADGGGKIASCIAEGGSECNCINANRAEMETCMKGCFSVMMESLCQEKV